MRRLRVALVASAWLTLLPAHAMADGIAVTVHEPDVAHDASSLAVAPDGSIWTADNGSDDLHRFDPESGVTERFPVGEFDGGLDGLTVGADGDVWFLPDRASVARLDPETGEVTTATDGGFPGVERLALDTAPDGRIWFSLFADPAGLGVIDPATNETTIIDDADLDFALTFSIEVAPDGTVWQAMIGNSFTDGAIGVRRYDPATGEASNFDLGEHAHLGLALDPEGDVWVSSYQEPEVADDEAALFEIDGADFTVTTHDINGAVGEFSGLAATSDGAIWVAGESPTLLRYDPATGDQMSYQATSGRGFGYEVVADDAGSVWLTIDGHLAHATHDPVDPTATITTPADGTTVTRADELSADYSCADDLALASCVVTMAATTVEDGAALDTSTLGDHELTVTATDTAGNTATLTHTYTVQPATCAGQPVTVDTRYHEQPTEGDDVILGTPGDDVIAGLGGDDVICGLGGDDTIHGNAGKDRLFGGADADQVHAGPGGGLTTGGPGPDDLIGGSGHDDLRGGPGHDTLDGRNGHDHLDGGGGRNGCDGGPGRNRLLRCRSVA